MNKSTQVLAGIGISFFLALICYGLSFIVTFALAPFYLAELGSATPGANPGVFNVLSLIHTGVPLLFYVAFSYAIKISIQDRYPLLAKIVIIPSLLVCTYLILAYLFTLLVHYTTAQLPLPY